MSQVGQMKQLTDREDGKFAGSIYTLLLDLPFQLHPLPKSDNPNKPTHAIVAETHSGQHVPIGSAWLRTAQSGENAGSKFFSLTFDEPSMPHALNVAAFRRKGSDVWDLTWRRRTAKPAAAA